MKTLFNLIRNFIIEHGSADIQTKHIALLKEQLSICSTEKEILNTANQNFKSEIADLRLKIDEYEKTNKQLQQKLEKHNIPPISASSPSEPDDYRSKRRGWIWK